MGDTAVIESATKSIFMQCLNDPKILEMIKEKLNGLEVSHNIQENQTQKQDKHKTFDNEWVICEDVINKLDLLLNSQKSIEEYIRCSSIKNGENLADKLKQERENHVIEIGELKKKYETEYKAFLEKSQRENLSLQDKNDKLLSENKKMEERIKELKNRYSICEEMIELWKCINSLNQDNRDYIERLCGGKQFLSILSLGRDENKIEQLWLYLKDLAVKGDAEEEIEIMNMFFEFCIKVCNSAKPDSEKYVISEVAVGSDFDMEKSIRTLDSRQVGNVRAVVVRGVMIGSTIKFKSIVKVE